MKGRCELIRRKCLDIQEDVEAWAKDEGILKARERIRVSIKISRLCSHEIVERELTGDDWGKILRLRCWTPRQKIILNAFEKSGNQPVLRGDLFDLVGRRYSFDTLNAVFTRKRLSYRFIDVERFSGASKLNPYMSDWEKHFKLFVVQLS